MEKIDDVQGSGNIIGFDARIYDSRLGRWMSVDPLQKEYTDLSPYNYVANSPLRNLEVNGKYFVGIDDKPVSVAYNQYGNITLSTNASPDLIRIVDMINNSCSPTAKAEFYTAGNSLTKIHFVIDTENYGGVGTGGLLGFHQPHGKDGKALNYNMESESWDGEVVFILDKSGNKIFKEATVTLFEKTFESPGQIQGKLNERGIDDSQATKQELMVAILGHELFHDRDPANIQRASDTQNDIPNSYTPEPDAYEISDKISNEIKQNRNEEDNRNYNEPE